MYARCTCAELFLEADVDASGYLDKREFTKVLESVQLNLSDRWVRWELAILASNTVLPCCMLHGPHVMDIGACEMERSGTIYFAGSGNLS